MFKKVIEEIVVQEEEIIKLEEYILDFLYDSAYMEH